MKRKELNQMPPEQAKQKLNEIRKELMKSNAQIAAGTIPKSPGQIRQMKRAIARILTTGRKKEKS